MDWDKLKTFYYIAQSGSITKATRLLNKSQGAVSRRLITLEDSLGIKLFKRVAGGVVLTRKGEILFKTVDEIMRKMRTTENILKGDSEEPAGSLKITGAGTWMSILLLDNLKEFSDLYPNIFLDITRTEITPNFGYNTTDVSILPFIPNQNNLVQKYLMTFNMGLYASPEYIEKYGEPKSVEDLNHHRLLNYGDYDNTFDNLSWHLSIGCPAGEVRVPFMRIKSGIGLRHAAKKGIGIASLSIENPALKKSNLIRILQNIQGPSIEVFLAYPKEIKDFKTIKALEDFLLEIVQRNNWL
jgi:DNA-binding transcriptional LysR family regulator